MKGKYFVLLFFITQFIYSQNKLFEINYDWGGIGIGTTYEIDNKFYFDFNADIFDFFIENEITGIGMIYNPIKFNYSKYYDEYLFNLSNIKLYWNFYEFPFRINKGNKNYIVGPFFSLDLINVYNFNRIDFMDIYNFGIMFNIKYGQKNYFYNNSIFNFELMYKKYNNKHSIYFGVKISYFTLIGVPIIMVDYLMTKDIQGY
jgi:hypothetical protein